MPTELNVPALKAAVQTAIQRHEDDYKRRVAEWEAAHYEVRREWVEKYNEAWLAALPKLRKTLREGKPITHGMLPKTEGGNSTATFSENDTWIRLAGRNVNKPGAYQPSTDLVTAAEVLELLSGDTVTPNGLDALGITKAAQRDLFRILGDMKRREETANAAEGA